MWEIVDSLQMAKELHPGRRNSLDALCDRYGISNAHRTLHGGLLDAALLAEVYLAMTRGQNTLSMDLSDAKDNHTAMIDAVSMPLADVIVQAANAQELKEHEALLDSLDKESKANLRPHSRGQDAQ